MTLARIRFALLHPLTAACGTEPKCWSHLASSGFGVIADVSPTALDACSLT